MGGQRKEEVLRKGKVSVERNGKIYTVSYSYLRGGYIRLGTGQGMRLGDMTEDMAARQFLREIVDSGYADREGSYVQTTKLEEEFPSHFAGYEITTEEIEPGTVWAQWVAYVRPLNSEKKEFVPSRAFRSREEAHKNAMIFVHEKG